MPPVFRKAIISSIAAIALTACQSVPQTTSAIIVSAYAPETPQLSCAPHGNPNGSPAKLTANRTRIGDPAYIEFRQRFSPAYPAVISMWFLGDWTPKATR